MITRNRRAGENEQSQISHWSENFILIIQNTVAVQMKEMASQRKNFILDNGYWF